MNELALPQEWSSKRLKHLATYNDEVLAESTDEDKEICYVEISGVSFSQGIEEIETISFGQAPSRARRKVRSGDILISTVRTYLRAIAKVDEASPNLIASTGFCVVRPNDDVDSGFLGWAAKSEQFVSEVVARSVGVSYPAINASELVTIHLPLPPLDMQRRIARILDEKTTQIDELIRKKRALLDRLAEKRHSLITRAVTKDLNYNASMKPSNSGAQSGDRRTVEDASDKSIVRLKHVADITAGQSPESAEITHTAEGLPFLQGCAEFGTRFPLTEKHCLNPPKTARKGSWLISVRAPVGRLNLADQEYCIGRGLAAVHPKGVHQGYLGYVLLDQGGFFNRVSTGSTFEAISTFQLLNLEIALPPLDTQKWIARFLDEKTTQIDRLVERIEESIVRLEEYRSAQVTAAVSGQLTELS